MKKPQPVALVGAGKLTDSPLARSWELGSLLGPVKASSLRLASRIANTLRAGHPVANYSEFRDCSLILIWVPDKAVPATVAELAASGISWSGKAVVLCNPWMDGSALRDLTALGASVGSIEPMPGFEERKYLVEGDRLVIREMKRVIEHRGTRIVAVEPGLKPFYLAAITCAGALFYSLLIAAAECMGHTLLPPSEMADVVEKQVQKTLRSYFRGGKKYYRGPKELGSQLQALSAADPRLAEYLEGLATAAAKFAAK